MAVFRIEKTRDYTVMSNHHLRNTELSLKAKGLLSMMLSLPEEWNYTTRGLASICKEGTESIGTALKELERTGYIVRNRLRDTEPTEPEKPAKQSNTGAILALVLILGAGGGAAYYFLVMKPKQAKNVPSDLDDFDLEDEEEYLNDDEESEDTI